MSEQQTSLNTVLTNLTAMLALSDTWVFLHTLLVSFASELEDICTFCFLKMLCFNSSSPLGQPASDWHDGGPWRHPGLPVQPGCQCHPRDSARTRNPCWVHLFETRSKTWSGLRGSRKDGGGRTRLEDPQVIHQHHFLHRGRVLKVPHLQTKKKGLGQNC